MPRIPKIRRKRFLLLGLLFISSLIVLIVIRAFMESPNEKIILQMIQLSATELVLHDVETVIYGPAKSMGCENSGSSHYFLLMIITSPENTEQRRAIRTVLKNSVPLWEQRIRSRHPQYEIGSGIRALFFVGRSPDNGTTLLDLMQEGRKNGDMIVDDFTESYFNLTLKTLRMLKWVERHCPQIPYLIKMDDDVYMDGHKIIDFLQNFGLRNDDQDLIGGLKFSNAARIRYPGSKWYTPAAIWDGDQYPDYLSGMCYILGSRARSQLYFGALERKLFHLEDLFLTGIVRDELAANIRIRNQLNTSVHNDEGELNAVQNIPGMHKWWVIWQKLANNCAALQNFAVIHPLSPKELLCYHHLEGGTGCNKYSWLPILVWC